MCLFPIINIDVLHCDTENCVQSGSHNAHVKAAVSVWLSAVVSVSNIKNDHVFTL